MKDLTPTFWRWVLFLGLFLLFLVALLIVTAPNASAPELVRNYSAGVPGSSLEFSEETENRLTFFAAVEAEQKRQAELAVAVVNRAPAHTETPPTPSDGSPWDGIAQCETGGDWSMQGSKYSGGLGFYNGTWDSYGGQEFATNAGLATREQQIIVAERVLADVGITAWGCHSYYG